MILVKQKQMECEAIIQENLSIIKSLDSIYKNTEKLFLNCIDFYRSKPTNGEFIAIIVDKIMMEEGKTSY